MTTTDLGRMLSGLSQGRERSFLTLQESAVCLGGLRYVEVGFFERVGRRAALLEPPAVATWAEAASLAAAWRASQIAELLPVSVGLPDAAELTRAAGAAVELALQVLGPPAEAGEDPDDPSRGAPDSAPAAGGPAIAGPAIAGPAIAGPQLADHVATSFYPALLAGYEARMSASSPAADGPVVRVLVRVMADLRAELKSASAVAETACRQA